jgi:hypothetical protein
VENINLLDFVLAELAARKGNWPAIAKAMDPESWESYYSWMTKLAQKRIPDPGVNKIQALADYFRADQAQSRKRDSEHDGARVGDERADVIAAGGTA